MPYSGMSAEYAGKLETAATVITVIFMVEMALKLVGLGCSQYWADGWNKLDGTIVILSGFDLGLSMLAAGSGVNFSSLGCCGCCACCGCCG